MVVRMAAVNSLLAFALCLLVGAFEADNPFTTTVRRALLAMLATLVIGLLIGAVFQAMLRENLQHEEQRLKGPATSAAPSETLGNDGKTST